MSSSSTKKKLLLNTVSIKLGCGSCRRPKLSHIFHPRTKTSANQKRHNRLSDFFTSTDLKDTTPALSPEMEHCDQLSESVAIEIKDSEDPYLDFRQSMLQMILENEIYCKDDLRELLSCILQLNSPCHHGIILRAFSEIWNAVFSVRSTASSSKPRFGCKSREF